MWTTYPTAAILTFVVLGLQVIIPACSLLTLTLHREFRFRHIESDCRHGTATIEIVTYEHDIQWTVEERECTWQGHSYDVVRVSRSNGRIRIIAVTDDEEDKAKNSISAALSRELRSERTLNKVLAAFLLFPVHTESSDLDTVMHTSAVKTPFSAYVVGMVEGWQGDVPTPPPWKWFRV